MSVVWLALRLGLGYLIGLAMMVVTGHDASHVSFRCQWCDGDGLKIASKSSESQPQQQSFQPSLHQSRCGMNETALFPAFYSETTYKQTHLDAKKDF